MRHLITIALAALLVSCASNGARAQASYQVIASCGTPPATLQAGGVRTGFMDTTGKICSAASITGGGDATAANQVLQITQETAVNTLLGLQADAACATDNGTCTLAALVKRLNQRLTTINTTLGTPFQAGGSIGNTSFGATQATAANLNATVVGAGTAGTANAGVVTVQGIASMTKLLVTPDSVALPANQSVNVAQINGVTPLMGNGATGTGSPRVSIANDNTIPTGWPSAANQTSIIGTLAAGTSATNSVLEGAVYNSTVPTLTTGQQVAAQADTTGARRISTEGQKTTYSSANSATIAASATDVAVLTGSASKTVRVTKIILTGIATANTTAGVLLVKRSTADTGGTIEATPAVIPHDSTNAAGTAVLVGYSANPTLGTGVGTLRQAKLTFNTAATSSVNSDKLEWEFGTRNTQTIVLRGVAQQLAVNFGGGTVTGGVLTYSFEWTEE